MRRIAIETLGKQFHLFNDVLTTTYFRYCRTENYKLWVRHFEICGKKLCGLSTDAEMGWGKAQKYQDTWCLNRSSNRNPPKTVFIHITKFGRLGWGIPVHSAVMARNWFLLFSSVKNMSATARTSSGSIKWVQTYKERTIKCVYWILHSFCSPGHLT